MLPGGQGHRKENDREKLVSAECKERRNYCPSAFGHRRAATSSACLILVVVAEFSVDGCWRFERFLSQFLNSVARDLNYRVERQHS